jgi:hypothetical protein
MVGLSGGWSGYGTGEVCAGVFVLFALSGCLVVVTLVSSIEFSLTSQWV